MKRRCAAFVLALLVSTTAWSAPRTGARPDFPRAGSPALAAGAGSSPTWSYEQSRPGTASMAEEGQPWSTKKKWFVWGGIAVVAVIAAVAIANSSGGGGGGGSGGY